MPPKIPPKKTQPKEQAKVLFSYSAENDDELTIKEGDIINIISKEIEDKGWMQGELNGKIGVFPDNFVQIIKPPLSSQTPTNNVFKNSSSIGNNNFNNSNNGLNNGTTTAATDESGPPKLPTKKPVQESKLSKVISSRFNEIISKSNSSLNESTTVSNNKTPLFLQSKHQITDDKSSSSIVSTGAPSLPLKKSKLFSTPKSPFQKESSTDQLDECTNDKPDNDLSSFIDEHNNSTKLTHLTASRVKGPNNRRPPSIIQVPKDDELSQTSSNSLNNLSDLVNSEKKESSSDNLDEISNSYSQSSNKELNKQTSRHNSISEMKVTTPTASQQPPPWMLELKKTQAEKKSVEVKMKKNFSLGDSENGGSTMNQSISSFNGTSPISSKKSLIATPGSPTKTTHRMSGDYSQRFKDFLQVQNSPSTNSLSRHSSVNNSNHNFNSSRTLSTDSLDCKEQTTSGLGFGQLASPFSSIVKPVKAAKPTTKFMSSSPTITGSQSLLSSNLNNNNQSNTTTSSLNNNTTNQSKESVSRKEFEELQKKVNDLTDTVETQKQTYKGLIKDLINDIAEEKKKVANLTIEVDRLRKLTTTV